MSQKKETTAQNPTVGQGLVRVAASVAQLTAELGKLGYHVGKDGVIRASGVSKKVGEEERTQFGRVVNGMSFTTLLGSLGYTVVTGDIAGGGAGVGISLGVRGRRYLWDFTKKVGKGLKWAFDECAGASEASAESTT